MSCNGDKTKELLNKFTSVDFGTIRTIKIGDKDYFVANDVAEILGYTRPRKAILDHCKGVLKQDVLINGGCQKISIIPLPDVFRLTTKSKLPEAQKFEVWVMEEVLPKLMNNNYYVDEENIDSKQIEELKERIDKLEKYRAEMEKYADELEEENKTMKDDYNLNNYYTIREAKEAFGWDIDFSTELLGKVSAELNKKAIPVKGYYYGKPTTYNRYHYLVWWKCYPFTKPQEVKGDAI